MCNACNDVSTSSKIGEATPGAVVVNIQVITYREKSNLTTGSGSHMHELMHTCIYWELRSHEMMLSASLLFSLLLSSTLKTLVATH